MKSLNVKPFVVFPQGIKIYLVEGKKSEVIITNKGCFGKMEPRDLKGSRQTSFSAGEICSWIVLLLLPMEFSVGR
jgi:hypothetical protein